jgi:hypothetical protein
MDFYHSWMYTQVLNTEWFMWTIVCLLLGINVLSPMIVWFAMRGRHLLKNYLNFRKQQR